MNGPSSLVLIGMPGCGKSTVGKLVARRLGWHFVDVDLEIEREAGMTLCEINASEGFEGLRRREREANLSLRPTKPTVYAPGGSVVYDEEAMEHLRQIGRVVWLDVPPDVLEVRAGDLTKRGVMIADGMTYGDLIEERRPLYERYAHERITCGRQSAKQVAAAVA